jgi:hypothetical protein
MHPLYTLGYSGWTAPELLRQVEQLGALLWDIRMAPYSRAPMWQQGSLRALLGDRYLHVRALGNINYNNGGPIRLAAPETCLNRLELALRAQPVILMCGCKDHATCHRTVAADFAVSRLPEVQVEHLYPPTAQPGSAPGYYLIPAGEDIGACKSCGAVIVWTRTPAGKAMPLDLASGREGPGGREALTHYATCPQGRDWRRR